MNDQSTKLPYLSYDQKRSLDACKSEARPDGRPVFFGSRIIDKDGAYYQERLRNAQAVAAHLLAEGYEARIVEGTDTADLPEGCGLDEVYDISVVAGPKLQTPEARAKRIGAAVPEAAQRLHAKCVQAAFSAGQAKRGRRIEVLATEDDRLDREGEPYAIALSAAEAVASRLRDEEKICADVVESEARRTDAEPSSPFAFIHRVRIDISL